MRPKSVNTLPFGELSQKEKYLLNFSKRIKQHHFKRCSDMINSTMTRIMIMGKFKKILKTKREDHRLSTFKNDLENAKEYIQDFRQ